MLGQWRVVLKQAEESAKAGNYAEALALAARPDVADHRQAVQLRARLALELLSRADRRAEADDEVGALDDLDLAESCGAPPDALAAARLKLADRLAAETRAALDAGDPARVVERVDRLAARKVGGPALRRLREAAEAWQGALADSRRGEFGRAIDQLDRAGRLAGPTAEAAVAASRRDLESRQSAAAAKVDRLYAALADQGPGPEALAAAEALLEVVPEHPAARQARSRAWQQIGALSPSVALPARPLAPSLGAAPEPEPDAILFLDDRSAPPPPASATPAPRFVAARPAAKGGETRCRLCGGPMGVQRNRTGRFLGCLRYPVCRGTAPMPELSPLARDDWAGAPAPGTIAARRESPYPALPAAMAPRAVAPQANRDPAAGPPAPASDRFLLWIDTVGGYLVCLGDEVVLGKATADSPADVPLMGDLSRRHATIVRDGDSYVLRAEHPCSINGRPVAGMAPLRDGDVLRLGPSVELEFRQPSPVSSTARLRFLSRHRLPMAVDGVLLMAQTCILGASSQSHVTAPSLVDPVILYRQGRDLWCRATGGYEVDGRPCLGRSALAGRSSVLGEGFSFSLEPLGPRASTA